MVVGIAVAVVVVARLMPVEGLSPSEKPVTAPVVAAAVEAGTEAEVMVAAPRGLSMKARAPPAAVVVAAAVLAAKVGAAPIVKPVRLAVVAAAAEAAAAAAAAAAAGAAEMGEAKRDGPVARVGWMEAGGAGVVEGLIPKANPPPWPVMAAAVGAG